VRNYIVRVYHCDRQNPVRMDGIVEVVESGAKLAFHDSDGLWAILVSTESDAANKPARPATKRKRPNGH
jgi:hypothetical protein